MNPVRLVAAAAVAFFCCAVPARATTVIPPTLDELVERSEAIVQGRVTATRCEWRGEGENRHIVTIVSLDVSETLVGVEQPSVELEFLGGEIGEHRFIVSGQTHFAPGGEEILFLSRQRSPLTPLVRMMYGRYLVGKTDDGRRFVARDNGVPLASVDEVAIAMTARPAGTVLAQIAAGRTLSPEGFAESVRATATRQGRRDVHPAKARAGQ